MEGTLFVVELVMIGAGCAAALASLFTFGGSIRNRAGLLALGLYLLAIGVGVSLIPQLNWPVAREDNAFLGQFLFSLILVPVGLILTVASGIQIARQPRAGQSALRAILIAAGGAVVSLGYLALRGPEPWQTRPTDVWGSGTFGFDIIAVSVAIGLAVFLAGRRPGRYGAASAGHTALA
jgi:hypothetical protein